MKVIEFLLKKSREKVEEGRELSSPAPVILCLVHRILWQRVVNQVNKLAILFKRSMFTQDSWDKPENDGCRRRWFSVCCMFVKQMYHSGSSANELALKAKDDVSDGYFKRLLSTICKSVKYPSPEAYASTSPSGGEVGRSMIEMLGVLAIIAVLSVGGIAGYSKAMEKYKTTKLMGEYNELVRNLLEYRPNFEKDYPNTVGGINFNKIVYNVGLLPATWHPDYQPAYFRDSKNNYFRVYWDCSNIETCSYVIVSTIGGNIRLDSKNPVNIRQECVSFFQYVIQPLHAVLRYGRGTWAFSGTGQAPLYYGDAYCDAKHKPCLRDMTLSDMQSSCAPCKDGRSCEVSMYF